MAVADAGALNHSHWLTPQSMVEQMRILAAFTLVLAGIAFWELVSHLSFDFSIITGRRKFQWPVILYFTCRLSMILHVVFFAWNMNTAQEIPCQLVVTVSKVTDMLGTVSSSAILALRSHAIWGRDVRVGALLSILLLTQAGLWGSTFYYSRSVWDPVTRLCRVVSTAPIKIMIPVFSFTMTYDFIILVLAAYPLWPERGYGGISTLLLRDGIGYFSVAFLANTLQTVMIALRLSPVMNLMCLPFALVASAIAATTVFRRIVNSPARLAQQRQESYRRAGLSSGASLPVFAPPPSKESQQGSANGYGYGYDLSTQRQGTTAASTLPPLLEWEDSSEVTSDKYPRAI